MTSRADRQYPPSSPPASAPTQRALLPSFEPTASFASVSGRKSSSSSPFKHRTPSRKRVRADTPSDDRACTPSRQRILPSEDDDIASRLPPLQTFYPTPAPTSSASLNASSPSKATRAFTPDGDEDNIFLDVPQQPIIRAPLSTVVLARVPRNGAELTLGRSSNSSSIVLSRTNKLISRVHVATRYISSANAIEVRCLGWNGARVGTPTGEYALAKGESIEIAADVNVIIDVCGERARVEVVADAEDDETDDEIFVSEKAGDATISDRDASPEEQSDPKVGFKIWEDREENSGNGVDKKENIPAAVSKSASHRYGNADPSPAQSTTAINIAGPSIMTSAGVIPSEAGEASPAPIVPVETGENTPTPVPKPNPSKPETDLNKLKIHIIAHLAYSRLASTPLSELRSSLPITNTLPVEILRTIIKSIRCVGVIQRQGKDASGKRLEEQYYYIPEHDEDEHRRAAVEELRGHPGIRSCRKVHKQYFWRKPALK
ncbi:hypothetical protein V1520DRAFT_168772 [Lipomyces starkeyi]|uniref:FHA domain-containing protein n=1 Tax=Lipomyces starkeyi NRRL Y-11557 TaxID=675824 RepID=A0A1E3PVT5_LIPST|nr:hypothetical protein LIPSTDRAFT_75763 [Lipomyces starkeyi NRRL Y-11557]